MWSWKESTYLQNVKHLIESEMTFDSSHETAKIRTKYHDPVDSLNTTVKIFRNSPELIHHHDSIIEIHHLVQ